MRGNLPDIVHPLPILKIKKQGHNCPRHEAWTLPIWHNPPSMLAVRYEAVLRPSRSHNFISFAALWVRTMVDIYFSSQPEPNNSGPDRETELLKPIASRFFGWAIFWSGMPSDKKQGYQAEVPLAPIGVRAMTLFIVALRDVFAFGRHAWAAIQLRGGHCLLPLGVRRYDCAIVREVTLPAGGSR